MWEEVFSTTRDARFTEEDLFVAGERGVLRWRFSWANEDGSPGHVRGVDVLRLRDGKVCEKLSYVKDDLGVRVLGMPFHDFSRRAQRAVPRRRPSRRCGAQ